MRVRCCIQIESWVHCCSCAWGCKRCEFVWASRPSWKEMFGPLVYAFRLACCLNWSENYYVLVTVVLKLTAKMILIEPILGRCHRWWLWNRYHAFLAVFFTAKLETFSIKIVWKFYYLLTHIYLNQIYCLKRANGIKLHLQHSKLHRCKISQMGRNAGFNWVILRYWTNWLWDW